MLTFDEIKEIIKMIDQSSIQHFELNQDGTQIIVGKYAVSSQNNTPLDSKGIKETISQQSTAAIKEESAKMMEEIEGSHLQKILSTTVGTFYSAPEPGADPFVKIGQQVDPGTVVCVLEAMKLFNEVVAGISGEIVEILFKDGEFVEYGAPLFLVNPE
jgi:acetyl-CoA carboxylase biotin carboxyl carrier protein